LSALPQQLLNIDPDAIIRAAKIENFKAGDFELVGLFPKQEEAMRILTQDGEVRQLLYGGGKGGGKSALGVLWLTFMSLAYPGTRYFVGRSELKKIMQSTWMTVQKMYEIHGLKVGVDYKFNGQMNYIQFTNGSRIDFLDFRRIPSDPDYTRYGSLEFTSGWLEEGGEINVGAFHVAKIIIGRHKNKEYGIKAKLLVTCNPARNWMYYEFYRPFINETLPSTRAFIPALVDENTFIDPDYRAILDELQGKDRARLLLGNWEYDDDPHRLITNEGIDALFYNSMLPTGRRCITGDIALQGSDLFVLAYWNGFRCEELVYIRKCDAKQVEEAVRAMAERNKVFSMRDICLDTQGIGSWLTAYLKGCVSYVSNKRPKKRKGDKNYATINDQVSFHLANRINEKGVFVNPERIFEYVPKTGKMEAVESVEVWEMINEELQQVKDAGIEDGKVRIVRKDDVKQVLGRSPDFWDNFKCREYLELSGTTYSSF
jgi:hypothetical protein